MRITFDSQIFCIQEYGGISRYFCALASRLSQIPQLDPMIVAPLHFNRHLQALNQKLHIGAYVPRQKGTGRAMKAISSALFRPIALVMKPDVVHETYYARRPSGGGKVPHAITVYDMIHERYREHFPASDPMIENKRAAILRADHIFCISENTRRDLLDAYPVSEKRVTVTYLSSEMPSLPADENATGEIQPFLLYVGDRRGYKNFLGLVQAFAKSPWLKDNFRITCFGGGNFSPSEREAFAALRLGETHIKHVAGGDACLARLYRAATLFIYPSIYEGFGIPLLEAMSLDCPIACSRSSSIPEVAGEAGEYFDPTDVSSIGHVLENVLQSASRRQELVALGRLQRQRFSWEQCAQETLLGYRELSA